MHHLRAPGWPPLAIEMHVEDVRENDEGNHGGSCHDEAGLHDSHSPDDVEVELWKALLVHSTACPCQSPHAHHSSN